MTNRRESKSAAAAARQAVTPRARTSPFVAPGARLPLPLLHASSVSRRSPTAVNSVFPVAMIGPPCRDPMGSGRTAVRRARRVAMVTVLVTFALAVVVFTCLTEQVDTPDSRSDHHALTHRKCLETPSGL